MWYLLETAPQTLNDRFFAWVREAEESLSVSLGTWAPSVEEADQIAFLANYFEAPIPRDLQVYYRHAYPFDRVRTGSRRWIERYQRYVDNWIEREIDRGSSAVSVRHSASTMSVLWPIDCFHSRDTVAFTTSENDLAVIEIDASASKVVPVALGLRNYFLSQVALQILAAEIDVEPDWSRLRKHPKVASLAQWPAQDPPRHFCLES